MALRKRGQTWWLDIATPGGNRFRRSAETTDRKAAQELHDKLKADLWRQAKLGDKPKYTWEDAALRWLNEQAHKASIRDDAKKIEMLTPFFRRAPLADLTWDRIQAVVEGHKGDRKPATRNRYYQLVRSILRRAMREWQWIDKVPVVRLHREPEGRVRYLSPPEIDTLLRNLPEHLRAMTLAQAQQRRVADPAEVTVRGQGGRWPVTRSRQLLDRLLLAVPQRVIQQGLLLLVLWLA